MLRLSFTVVLASLILSGCTPYSPGRITLDQPVENTIFNQGETIFFIGNISGMIRSFDKGLLKVTNLNTGQLVLNESFQTDFAFDLEHNFSDTTVLQVKCTALFEGSNEEELIKSMTITCFP